jgi:hypothetical protein
LLAIQAQEMPTMKKCSRLVPVAAFFACFSGVAVSAYAAGLEAEVPQYAPTGFLQGQVGASNDLPQLTPYGFRCQKEADKQFPTRVIEVDYNSTASRQGLVVGDRILSASGDRAGYVMTIEREGKRYTLDLHAERAGSAPLNGNAALFSANANKLAMMPTSSSNLLNAHANHQDQHLAGLHPFTAKDVALVGRDGVIQGRYPNCWFEACLSALAATPNGQREIAEVITATPGQYEVKLPGIENVVAVSDTSIDMMGLANRAKWASIIECAEREALPNNADSQKATQGYPAIQLGLEILTAQHVRAARASELSDTELSRIFQYGVNAKIPVVVSSKGPNEHHQPIQPITPDHAYSVVSFDPVSQCVTLRNPLGREEKPRRLSSRRRQNFAQPEESSQSYGIQYLGGAYVSMDLASCRTFLRYVAYPDGPK